MGVANFHAAGSSSRRRVRRARCVLAGALLAFAGACLGQAQPAQNGVTRGAGDTITLNFQNADIGALINTVSQITGKNFIVDPRVKGKVTLISGGKFPASRIYEVFLSVLEVHNFATVPSGDVIKIVPSNIVKQQPTPMSFGATAPSVDEQITQVYQLEFGSVQELVPILRPLLPPTSHFAAHASSNTLVFTDTAANVERVLRIIERIDQPDRRADVHVVYLENAQAKELAPVLSQVAAGLQAGGDPQTQRLRITVQADGAINALVIQAPETEFNLLRAVVDQLDIERPAEGDVRVVYLRHSKAADLVGIVNEIAQGGAVGGEGAAGAQKVSVQADEGTNALVIRAAERQFRELQSVIEKLDLKRAQVFVETVIAEVSTNMAAELGVEWSFLQQNADGSEVGGDTQFSDQEGGLRLGFINELVENIAGDTLPDLAVVLRALRADANSNILSTPNLLTLENETAEIVVAQEVPFVTGQFVTSASPVTTEPVETPGGDTGAVQVTNPFQTIERKDVGLILRITPQINEGDTIRLEIEQEISNVSRTTVQGASDLITDKRQINTTVQVDDARIIVLGGLIRDDLTDTVEWVPVLGKLPVIGALFRKKSKEVIKRNLMVFLRPRVVREDTDLAVVTREKYDDVRDRQEVAAPDTVKMIDGAVPPRLPAIEWGIEHGVPASGGDPNGQSR